MALSFESFEELPLKFLKRLSSGVLLETVLRASHEVSPRLSLRSSLGTDSDNSLKAGKKSAQSGAFVTSLNNSNLKAEWGVFKRDNGKELFQDVLLKIL